ncbi:MAG: AMP-binding protein, partial [Firmicutes bacterium]|nr:AMP-binding protein [Bacillota bacterium]
MKLAKEATPRFKAPCHENLRDLIAYVGKEYKDDLAFIIKHKAPRGQEPTYERITFGGFAEDVKNLGAALFERDLLTHRVAIIGKNCYEWLISYFAAVSGNAMVVPLDKGLPYEEFESCMVRS